MLTAKLQLVARPRSRSPRCGLDDAYIPRYYQGNCFRFLASFAKPSCAGGPGGPGGPLAPEPGSQAADCWDDGVVVVAIIIARALWQLPDINDMTLAQWEKVPTQTSYRKGVAVAARKDETGSHLDSGKPTGVGVEQYLRQWRCPDGEGEMLHEMDPRPRAKPLELR
jgi:hypothetical protein